jgi:RsiW-degrading membrane proteinase PrsW (M82 family)
MITAIFLGAIVPIIFLIVILKDENRLMMAFFAWGLIAFMLSLTLNDAILESQVMDEATLSMTWAPVVEELIKALPLVYFFLGKKQMRFPIVYFAFAAGIGFSILENCTYLLNNFGNTDSPLYYIVLRSITTSLLHGILTAVIGYGIILLRTLNVLKFPLLFGLFSVAVILHALFNMYTGSELKIVGLLMPILLYLIGIMLLSQNIKGKGEEPEPSAPSGQ